MPDLMQQLHDARPTEAELNAMWPEHQRADSLARVLSGSTHASRPPKRVAALVAAAAVAGFAVMPAVIGSGDASAQADLQALAMSAIAAEGPVIAEGTFLHIKTEALQKNSRVFGDGQTLDTNRESWVRWDGKTWAIDTRPSAGWREYHVFPRTDEEDAFSNPTPEFAASLPDDPDTLRAFLDEHVSGSNSHEEALFVAVADLARSHFLPPETLSAALQVLADVDGVDTEDVTVQGRSAVEITYSSLWGLAGRESITVDRDTARVLSASESDPGGTYDLSTTLVEVVAEIPQDVQARYRELQPGTRVFD